MSPRSILIIEDDTTLLRGLKDKATEAADQIGEAAGSAAEAVGKATDTVVDSIRCAVSSLGVSACVRLTSTPATQPARRPWLAHIVNSVAASIS